ncbi:unnamed protein product [Protopolystoma xenopodis]|uniref:Uncharacterized protein n=1 Tax=Protopolystoma xenopodis TaxID=117903 RepID=A0A3S5B1U6_9PLAT|nr:unnamed protein product [Protopolystoma xenopodis]
MNIGLCAFLLIAHRLQQNEAAEPLPMPQQHSTGPGCSPGSPSGMTSVVVGASQTASASAMAVGGGGGNASCLGSGAGAGPVWRLPFGGKRTFFQHGTNLNDALGFSLGIQAYLGPVRRAFEVILRQLDVQVCRTMMMQTKLDLIPKDVDETILYLACRNASELRFWFKFQSRCSTRLF